MNDYMYVALICAIVAIMIVLGGIDSDVGCSDVELYGYFAQD